MDVQSIRKEVADSIALSQNVKKLTCVSDSIKGKTYQSEWIIKRKRYKAVISDLDNPQSEVKLYPL